MLPSRNSTLSMPCSDAYFRASVNSASSRSMPIACPAAWERPTVIEPGPQPTSRTRSRSPMNARTKSAYSAALRVRIKSSKLDGAPVVGGSLIAWAASGNEYRTRGSSSAVEDGPIGSEEPWSLVRHLDAEPSVVHEPVVAPAEKDEVGKARRAAVRPMINMMRVAPARRSITAGEGAPTVANGDRPSKRRRHDLGLPSDVQRLRVAV